MFWLRESWDTGHFLQELDSLLAHALENAVQNYADPAIMQDNCYQKLSLMYGYL